MRVGPSGIVRLASVVGDSVVLCCVPEYLPSRNFFDVCRPIAQPPQFPLASRIVGIGMSVEYAHSQGLGRSTVGDLLDAEGVELSLQLLELLGELLLVLAPELTSLDLGRLEKREQSAALFRYSDGVTTYHGD